MNAETLAAYTFAMYAALNVLVCCALFLAGWYAKAHDIADKQRRQEKVWADYDAARGIKFRKVGDPVRSRTFTSEPYVMRADNFTMEPEGIPGSDEMEQSDVG